MRGFISAISLWRARWPALSPKRLSPHHRWPLPTSPSSTAPARLLSLTPNVRIEEAVISLRSLLRASASKTVAGDVKIDRTGKFLIPGFFR